MACMQRAGVEQTLWKVVYYRPIEEFRRRIRLAADAGDRGCEPLRKVGIASHGLLQVPCTARSNRAIGSWTHCACLGPVTLAGCHAP